MEKTAILACPTVRDELNKCMRDTGCSFDVYELEQSSHDRPEKLRGLIQAAIDDLQEYDRILLLFGVCGNATLGLISPHAELVLPRVDDCVSLLMGSPARRLESLNGKFGLFLTAGWLRYEEGMWGEFCHTISKYGEKRAQRILNALYENLTYLTILDTGAYELDEIYPQAQELADALHLQLRILPADLTLLCSFLTEPEDTEKFIHVPAGTAVREDMLKISFS